MDQSKINELHSIMVDFFFENQVKESYILSFLMITYLGTLANAGFSQEKVEDICDRMKMKYSEIKGKSQTNKDIIRHE